MTTTKPATPLPWTLRYKGAGGWQISTPEGCFWECRSVGMTREIAHDHFKRLLTSERDALRAAHADLVATLRAGEDEPCAFDVLNPCFDGRNTDVVGKHWGVGAACPACHRRALLAKLGETP